MFSKSACHLFSVHCSQDWSEVVCCRFLLVVDECDYCVVFSQNLATSEILYDEAFRSLETAMKSLVQPVSSNAQTLPQQHCVLIFIKSYI